MIDVIDKIQSFTAMSRLSNSEVITPKNIVKDMVDLLSADVFNPDAKFLDPAVKSGRFLIEIYYRLMNSPLLAHMPEDERKKHILENQLYGVATSSFAAAIVRRALYNDPYETGNIVYTADKVTKEMIQGAFKVMEFNVVIGNPPYNKDIFLDFVSMGYDLSSQYTCMITPAKWQTNADNARTASKISYKQFREKLVKHIRHVVFYPDCKDVFEIMQADGISYYLMDKATHDICIVTNKCDAVSYFNGEKDRPRPCLKNDTALYYFNKMAIAAI